MSLFSAALQQYESNALAFLAYCGGGWLIVAICCAVISSRISATYNKLSFADKVYWLSICMSTVHAIFALVFGVLNLQEGEDWTTEDLCTSTLLWRNAAFFVCIGYFIVDVLMSLGYSGLAGGKGVDLSFIFHHFFVGSSLLLSINFGFLTWFLAAMLLNEMSTIFVNVRFFLVTLGMKKSSAYIYNGILLTLIFFLCRIVFLPILFFFFVAKFGSCWTADVPAIVRIVAIVNFPILWGLNLIWFRKLVMGALKVLRGNEERLIPADAQD